MGDVVYIRSTPYIREHIRIKNMICDCCMTVIRQLLESNQVIVESLTPGRAVVLFDSEKFSSEKMEELLKPYGMGIIKSREEQMVDDIKRAVIDLVHKMNNVNSIVRKSEYLVEKTGMNYQLLSKIFSRHSKITLEKYIILNKIERIKELIDQGEFTLSEIAYMMDYSSVAYLSGQFKKVTGYSVSDYKAGKGDKTPINRI